MSIDPRHWRNLVITAVLDSNTARIDSIVAALIEAENAKRILRAKGFGYAGLSVDKTASLVPHSQEVD